VNICKSGLGKTDEAIGLVLKNICIRVELGDSHQGRVLDIMGQGCSGTLETKLLQERTMESSFAKAQKAFIHYVANDIRDQAKILALIMMLCRWGLGAQDSSAYFLYAGSCVQLLEDLDSPLHRGALLIYQTVLFEKGNAQGAFEILFDLPTVSVSADKSDNYHARSAWLKGCAYEMVGKYIEATKAFKEIGPNDPWVYALRGAKEVTALEPLVEKQVEEEECCCVLF